MFFRRPEGFIYQKETEHDIRRRINFVLDKSQGEARGERDPKNGACMGVSENRVSNFIRTGSFVTPDELSRGVEFSALTFPPTKWLKQKNGGLWLGFNPFTEAKKQAEKENLRDSLHYFLSAKLASFFRAGQISVIADILFEVVFLKNKAPWVKQEYERFDNALKEGGFVALGDLTSAFKEVKTDGGVVISLDETVLSEQNFEYTKGHNEGYLFYEDGSAFPLNMIRSISLADNRSKYLDNLRKRL